MKENLNKLTVNPKILVYGYGNPGRQDDGLGIFLAEKIEAWAKTNKIENISIDTNYQLNIEDAAVIEDKDIVIFADASQEEDIDSFLLTKVNPSPEVEFTMHAVSPSLVLYLCKDIYKKTPLTALLHIKGYEWELKEGLTLKASENLEKAFIYLTEKLLRSDALNHVFIS